MKRPLVVKSSNVSSLLFWHFARQLGPWLLVIAAYVLAATLVVRWDMQRVGDDSQDFAADLYGMYTQLFFEPTLPFPRAPVARVIFWITPLLGAVLLARGLLRVGASLFDAEGRHRLWVKIMSEQMRDHIVICGLGNVGSRVVESLRALSVPVIAIEKRTTDSRAGIIEALGVPVLYGDARNDEILLQAGVRHAKTIVCATDDDLTNVEVAVDAKRENPSIRVVMRMFDQRVAHKMRTALDLDETFSTSALAAPLIALQATAPGVRGVYRLDDGSLRADMEIPVPPGWAGRSVAECEDELDACVVGIRKPGGVFTRARWNLLLVEGDVVTLDLPAERVGELAASMPRASVL